LNIRLEFDIHPQPTDSSCGPTCLHAVYRYYGDALPLPQLIDEVQPVETGGTLAVCLALHALRRGYRARIYTYNLEMFDPSWFTEPGTDLAAKLGAQRRAKRGRRLAHATEHYLEFLRLGGELRFEDLTGALLRRYLARDVPVLTGLSATYLYGCARESGTDVLRPDDVGGVATGHFVVLHGYDSEKRLVHVADPLLDNPLGKSHHYAVKMQRVLGAIFLGVLTYDANFLILEPPDKP